MLSQLISLSYNIGFDMPAKRFGNDAGLLHLLQMDRIEQRLS